MEKNQKIINILELAFIILFLFLIGSGNVINPFFGDVNLIDEGQFGAWLTHMLHGGHLYKDTYAAYGPFYIYPLYLLAKIFGPSVFLIRIVYIVVNGFLAILVSKKVMQALKLPRFLQWFAFILLLIIPGFGMRQGMALLSLFLFYRAFEKKSCLLGLFSGICLAATFLTSSDMGIFSSLIVAGYTLFKLIFSQTIKKVINISLYSIAGFMSVISTFAFWSFKEGWFFAYINSITDDLTAYSGIALPNGQNFPNALSLMPHTLSVVSWLKYVSSRELLLYWLFLFYIISFCYILIRIIRRAIKKEEEMLVLLTFLGFFLSAILIGRFGHFNFVLSPVFISFAFYLNVLIGRVKNSKKGFENNIALLLISIILIFSLRLVSLYRPHFADALKVPKAVFTNQKNPKFIGPVEISGLQKKNILIIQDFINKNTEKEDNVFFFNNEPMMYMLVDRVSPTRFDLPEVVNSKEKRYEVIDDLTSHKTKYIIDDLDAWAVDGVSNRERLPEVMQYINENYTKKQINNFVIFTLKEAK